MEITSANFKKLLVTLKQSGIGIRVKTHSGWSTHFLHIIGFISPGSDHADDTFSGIALSNSSETEGLLINNIATVSEFQIERDCLDCKADVTHLILDHKQVSSFINR